MFFECLLAVLISEIRQLLQGILVPFFSATCHLDPYSTPKFVMIIYANKIGSLDASVFLHSISCFCRLQLTHIR
uniref:Uncharacterized protein n=1 Tax=Populus trichocarpa TaxID=3694 RepID=A0A2K1WYE2_POPTR